LAVAPAASRVWRITVTGQAIADRHFRPAGDMARLTLLVVDHAALADIKMA